MPTYEYECSSCGKNFDLFQSMSDTPVDTCPDCGQRVRRRINGGTGIIFKGSGFYKNDSRKPAASSGESSASKGAAESGASKSTGDAAPKSDVAPKGDSAAKGDAAPKADGSKKETA